MYATQLRQQERAGCRVPERVRANVDYLFEYVPVQSIPFLPLGAGMISSGSVNTFEFDTDTGEASA